MKQIILCIPEDTKVENDLPLGYNSYTPVENLFIVKFGIYALNECKKCHSQMQNNDLYKEYDAKLKEKDFIIQIMKDTKENIIKNIAEKEKENQSAEWETKKSYYLEIIQREQEEKRQFQKEHTEKTQKEMELWKTEWKEQLNELKKENQILKEIEREKIRIENVLQQSNKNTANEVALQWKEKENQYKEEIRNYKEKINEIKREMDKKMEEWEKNRLKTQNETLMTENQKITQQMMTQIDILTKQNNRSNRQGKEGEELFYTLANETFETFNDFSILNQSKIPHSGDFHLHFGSVYYPENGIIPQSLPPVKTREKGEGGGGGGHRFSILVDVKNYVVGRVNADEIKKLKNDVKRNPQFKVAWLVSIENSISNHGQSSFQLEIDDGILYCYINSLNKWENPTDLLKNVWYSSKVIYDNMLNKEGDTELLNKYKKRNIRIKKIAENMTQEIKNSYTSINQIKENINNLEKNTREILNDEIMSVREHQTEIVMGWWKDNIEPSPPPTGGQLKTKALYDKFKATDDNDKKVDVDSFKIILKSFLDEKDVEIKNERSQYIIRNVKWKI